MSQQVLDTLPLAALYALEWQAAQEEPQDDSPTWEDDPIKWICTQQLV